MRKSILRFAFAVSAVAIVTLSACKGGVKDADIEKAVTEKITAASADVADAGATVKDGVVTLNGMFKDEASKTAFETTVKAIPGVKSVVNNTRVIPPPPAPAPVEIAADDPLTKGVADATKDFPGVKAEVKDGVITLTGEIKRSSLPTLLKALHTLKPKKIENKLTVK
jgi:hyperosmotically inducible protein